MRRFAWLAGLAVWWASRALAQGDLPLELDWRAPAECPAADALRAELARIASAREGSTLQPLHARAEVRRDHAGGYVLTLHTEHAGAHGTRQLMAADCPTLVRSATLVLALAFGPGVEWSSGEQQPPEPAAEVPAPAIAVATPASPPVAAVTEGDDPVRPTWQLWLGAGAQFALLPQTAFSGSLGVELQLEHVSFGLRALVLPGVSDDLDLPQGTLGARFGALGAAARGCGLLAAGPLALGACAALQLSAIRAQSAGNDELDGGSATAPWYAIGAGLTLSWPRTAALRLRFEAELMCSLNRPQFAVEGLGDAYRVPLWAPLLAAGVVLSL